MDRTHHSMRADYVPRRANGRDSFIEPLINKIY